MSDIEDQIDELESQIPEDRRRKLSKVISDSVAAAVKDQLEHLKIAENAELHREDHSFIAEHREFIKMFVEREVKRNKLRDVVTEKLVTGGMFAFITFLCYSAWDYIRLHIK